MAHGRRYRNARKTASPSASCDADLCGLLQNEAGTSGEKWHKSGTRCSSDVPAASDGYPDLFGLVQEPSQVKQRRRSCKPSSEAEDELFALRLRCLEVFKGLVQSIDDVIETFSVAMVDWQTEDNAGEIDRLIEELRDEISDEVRAARREVVL